jgi:hypothetical protein
LTRQKLGILLGTRGFWIPYRPTCALDLRLIVDDLFKLLQRLSTVQEDAIDEVGRGAGNANFISLLPIGGAGTFPTQASIWPGWRRC